MKRLEGKVAIVTGASSGIGLETALTFAREGANLVLAARRIDRLHEVESQAKEIGVDAISVQADLSTKEACKEVVEKAIEKFGKIDILVNNAGIIDKHKSITSCDEDYYEEVRKIDQDSVYFMMKYALEYMEKQGNGSIINVSSISGVAPVGGFTYTAAKTALLGMSKSVALQFAGKGIRCNVICPGPTPTECNTPEKLADFDDFKEVCAKHLNLSLPESTVQDQANGILFFASDESKCITGQVLTIDNGVTL